MPGRRSPHRRRSVPYSRARARFRRLRLDTKASDQRFVTRTAASFIDLVTKLYTDFAEDDDSRDWGAAEHGEVAVVVRDTAAVLAHGGAV